MGIPRHCTTTLRATLSLTSPRSKSTSDTLVLRRSEFILTTIRPRALEKYSIFVFHNSLAIGPTLVVHLASVKAEVAKLIREWHLFDVAGSNLFIYGRPFPRITAEEFTLFVIAVAIFSDLSSWGFCRVIHPLVALVNSSVLKIWLLNTHHSFWGWQRWS
jgi:hypothetical protein